MTMTLPKGKGCCDVAIMWHLHDPFLQHITYNWPAEVLELSHLA